MEIQTENQVDALKSLNLSNKTVELKQIEGKFPKYLLNDLIIYKLQNIIKLQEVIKSNELDYKWKRGKIYNFSKHALAIDFKRYILQEINIKWSQ